MITINYGKAKSVELIEALVFITITAIVVTFFWREPTNVQITSEGLGYICERIATHGN